MARGRGGERGRSEGLCVAYAPRAIAQGPRVALALRFGTKRALGSCSRLSELVTAIKPAVIVAEKTPSGTLLDNAIAENVRRQVARLKTSPPVVQAAYAGKKIDIVGGVYDIATGTVTAV